MGFVGGREKGGLGRTVVAGSASRASAVVVVLVEEAAALLAALRDALGVGVGVDLDAGDVALEDGLVLDCPAHDVDVDGLVRELVEAGQHGDPLVERLAHGGLGLLAHLGRHGLGALPAHAVVDLALAVHHLVVAVVLEA